MGPAGRPVGVAGGIGGTLVMADALDNRGRLRRKLIVTCVMLAVTGGLSLLAATTGRKTTQGHRAQSAIPVRLPPDNPVWLGSEQPLEPRILEILKTTDCLNREYRKANLGFPVYLTIVYSERNRKGVHPPKVCLQGTGELALKETPVRLPGLGGDGGDLEALEMITERGMWRTYHLYFYKCGHVYTPSFVRQQLVIWLNGLTSRDASGALIRLSAPIVDNDDEGTRQAVREVLGLVMPYIHKGL